MRSRRAGGSSSWRSLIAPLDAAGQHFTQVDTLRGLQGILVLVEPLHADAKRDGLTETAIRTDAQLKLRAVGIRLLSVAEFVLEPGAPYLYINISTLKSDGSYAFCVHVELHQRVQSLVRPGATFDAITWNRGSVGTVGPFNPRWVRDSVKDKVDQFINDYLTVNPKKGG